MTRINVVRPSILSRQHLLAEWHEIGRIITLAEGGVDPREIPVRYTLGKGHMKFFANKLGFITMRMALIANELRSRGFKVDPKINLNAVARAILVGFGTPWSPDDEDIAVNLSRLVEREPNNDAYRQELARLAMEHAL